MLNLKDVIILVIVMALTTYLIRVIPFVFFKKKIKSIFIKSLLYYIPYAVLTAMTFPVVFYVTGNVYSSVFGTLVAVVASIFKKSLVTVAILAIIAILAMEGVFLLI